MPFDYDALRFWWAVAITLGNIGVWIFAYFSAKDKGNETRVSALEQKCSIKQNETDLRLTRIETELEHMPSSSEIAELQANMKGLQADVRSISSSLTGMYRQLELINQHLLNQTQ